MPRMLPDGCIAMLPAAALCYGWGQSGPWIIVLSVPIAAVAHTWLFDLAASPMIEDAPLRDFVGESAVVEEILGVAGLALLQER